MQNTRPSFPRFNSRGNKHEDSDDGSATLSAESCGAGFTSESEEGRLGHNDTKTSN